MTPPKDAKAAAGKGARGAKGPDPLWFLLIMLAFVVGGWFLVQKLIAMSRIQDCVMSGRRNCAPIDPDNP